MVYRPNIDPERCFVLLPLRAPFLGYFEQIIRPVAQSENLVAVKADDIYGTRAVIKDIWEYIWTSRIVIAIVTDKNPNVNYELGICHTLGIPTILMTERDEDVPFDYRHRRYVPYLPKEAGWEEKLRDNLKKTIRAALASGVSDEELPWPYSTFDLQVNRRAGRPLSDVDARGLVVHGAQLVSQSAAPAFGPHGTAVSVFVRSSDRQIPYRQGIQISRNIHPEQPLEVQGAEQMSRLASEIYASVGDATKGGLLLSASMIERGNEALNLGCMPKHLVNGMEKAVDAAVSYIMTSAKVADWDDLRLIARTASRSDEICAALVTEALMKVGDDSVDVREGQGPEPTLELEVGMKLNEGFISSSMINDSERQQCVFSDCYVLLHEASIGSFQELIPLVKLVAQEGRPLLIVSSDFNDAILSFLAVNNQRQTLSTVAVKAPGRGEYRRALLEDIAIFAGGKPILQGEAESLQVATLKSLGRVGSLVVSRRDTYMVDGGGSGEEIAARVLTLRRQIASTSNPSDAARLRERLARLSGGVAILNSGGLTEAEKIDSFYRLETALSATVAARRNGFVLGGGLTYYRAKSQVERLVPSNESEAMGITAISRALEQPLRQLLRNSKTKDEDGSMRTIAEGANDGIGFNAETGVIESLSQEGILDSARSLADSLRIAFAYARGVLTTGSWDWAGTEHP